MSVIIFPVHHGTEEIFFCFLVFLFSTFYFFVFVFRLEEGEGKPMHVFEVSMVKVSEMEIMTAILLHIYICWRERGKKAV